MDAEPVAIPEGLPLDRAEGEYFLRYGWPWFPVVDVRAVWSGGGPRGRRERPDTIRGGRPTASVMARDDGDSGLRAQLEDPLEALLTHEAWAASAPSWRSTATACLRGIVTVDAVRRALQRAAPSPA